MRHRRIPQFSSHVPNKYYLQKKLMHMVFLLLWAIFVISFRLTSLNDQHNGVYKKDQDILCFLPETEDSINMKQKIAMKVQMNCQKCRSKALAVAAGTNGVDFVGFEGEDKDKVVVIGDGVDAAKLASCMRKKVGYTDIISVAEVKK